MKMTRKGAAGAGAPAPVISEHFITSLDGTRIFYNSTGKGFPLICSDGIACDMYAWKYIVQGFGRACRIIRWNLRGHGRSDSPESLDNLTIENCADDVAAIMDAEGIDGAVHLGHSMGVQVIFELYRRHPRKVKALVPITGSYGHPLQTMHDNPMADKLFPYIYELITTYSKDIEPFWKKLVPTNIIWKLATLMEINGKLVKQSDFMPYLDHVSKMDLNLFIRMLKFANEHTARDMLHTIKVPTLIFGAEHDKFTPVWLSNEMHNLIPRSEFQFLKLGTHTAPIEHEDLIELRLDRFLRRHFAGEYGSGALPAVRKPAAGKKRAVKGGRAAEPSPAVPATEPPAMPGQEQAKTE
jgi:pimeloyl-ACP methyl ester carboxylesterase